MIRSRTLLYISLGLIGTLLFTALAVIVTGQVARNHLAREYPAPGKMIQSGKHRLHVYCEGTGPVTILLEAGLNDFSVRWGRVQSMLSRHSKTCVYDRAGMGWSEAGEQTPTLESAATDLNNVIEAVAPNQPLVLVGHSYGGIIVRAYAQLHRGNIKGMVLVDPASEHMPERIQGYREVLAGAAEQFGTLAVLSALGLMALSPEDIPASQLAGDDLAQYRARLASGEFFNAAAAETGAMYVNLQAMKEVAAKETIKWPVVVISRGQPDPIPGLPEASARSLEQSWGELQADMVVRLKAEQVIARESSHNIPSMQPEIVYETILPLVSGQTGDVARFRD